MPRECSPDFPVPACPNAVPRLSACGTLIVQVQHLLLNRNDLLVGGLKPHNYCLPVLKARALSVGCDLDRRMQQTAHGPDRLRTSNM
jgi:hypothetical protein